MLWECCGKETGRGWVMGLSGLQFKQSGWGWQLSRDLREVRGWAVRLSLGREFCWAQMLGGRMVQRLPGGPRGAPGWRQQGSVEESKLERYQGLGCLNKKRQDPAEKHCWGRCAEECKGEGTAGRPGDSSGLWRWSGPKVAGLGWWRCLWGWWQWSWFRDGCVVWTGVRLHLLLNKVIEHFISSLLGIYNII